MGEAGHASEFEDAQIAMPHVANVLDRAVVQVAAQLAVSSPWLLD